MLKKKKATGYPSIDKTHLKNTKFLDRHPIIPFLSVSTLFELVSIGHQDHIAIEQRSLKLTNAGFIRTYRIVARALVAMNIKRGDIIIVTSKPVYQALAIFFAANYIGAVVSFLDPEISKDILEQYLNEYQAPILVTNVNENINVMDFFKKAKSLSYIINIKPSEEDELLYDTDQIYPQDSHIYNFCSLTSVAKKLKQRIRVRRFNSRDGALLAHSSGSTGKIKPMVFTNRHLVAGSINSKAISGVKIHDKNFKRWLSGGGFHVMYGIGISAITPLLGGGTLVLMPDGLKDEKDIIKFFEKDPDAMFVAPTLIQMAMKVLPKTLRCPNLKRVMSGGDTLTERLSKEFTEFMKAHGANLMVCNGYGTTESFGCISVAIGGEYRPKTVGRLFPGIRSLILDDALNEVKYNEPGKIYVSGAHVISKYYNSPELDKLYFVNIGGVTYLKTDDTVMLDEEGYLTFLGRGNPFFIDATPGKVWYSLTQQIISKIDVVDDCAVVPKPDEKLLFVCEAYIVLKPGVSRDDETKLHIIKETEKHRIYGNALPSSIVFMDALPRTAAGKVDMKLLENRSRNFN